MNSREPLPREHSERLNAVGRVVDAAAHAWHSDHPDAHAIIPGLETSVWWDDRLFA